MGRAGRRQKDPDRLRGALLLALCVCGIPGKSDALNIVQQRQMALRGCSYALAGMASAASSYPFKKLATQSGGLASHTAVLAVADSMAEGVSHGHDAGLSAAAGTGGSEALVATAATAATATVAACAASCIFSVGHIAGALQARNPIKSMRRGFRGGGGGAPAAAAQPGSYAFAAAPVPAGSVSPPMGMGGSETAASKDNKGTPRGARGAQPCAQQQPAKLAGGAVAARPVVTPLETSEVSAAVCAATTVLALNTVARDLAATGLTKAVTLTSYDQIFTHVRACRPGGALWGFPAVLAAAAGTGIVASLISQNAPARRMAAGGKVRAQSVGRGRAERQKFVHNMSKEMLGYAAFFGIYHAVFLLLPQCGYSTLGQAAGGATASLLSSYVPTDFTKWRVPTKILCAQPDGLACAQPVPQGLLTVAQALEKAETFVRTAAFCGVSYAVGSRLGA